MKEYIEEKIKVLKELHVYSKCNKEEKQRLKECTTEIQADNIARSIIMSHLG